LKLTTGADWFGARLRVPTHGAVAFLD
jgi:hypothetical protein